MDGLIKERGDFDTDMAIFIDFVIPTQMHTIISFINLSL
jgi:hypothetical protein